MEPPPMCSVWLENEDAGLLLTSNSTSSENASRCLLAAEGPPPESGGKSSTLDLFACSDKMCNANFNPLEKASEWPGLTALDCDSKHLVAIKPPPQFQDSPPPKADAWLERFASRLVSEACDEALRGRRRHRGRAFSPCHGRLSSSHGSLTANKADDSSFITSAMSHDVLVADVYNDVYAVPVDVVRPRQPRPRQHHRKRRRQVHAPVALRPASPGPGSSARRRDRSEPIHMTLQEVRQYLHNLYSSSSDSSEHNRHVTPTTVNNNVNNNVGKHKKNTFVINIKNKKAKESCEIRSKDNTSVDFSNEKDKLKKNSGRLGFSSNLKQTLCNIFRIRKPPTSPERGRRAVVLQVVEEIDADVLIEARAPFLRRALPPLPANTPAPTLDPADPDPPTLGDHPGEEPSMDFASSIEKVKDYGWYWGPISGEAAEKILSNEPDGSFIVRDSSDDHYIFSLTFKLNACIRHVRIEHDQGNFSFGSCTKFKSHTIVDFIENAVEHSRSGRYLFFLHRRPVLGPMRVQLLHPVSRFKQVQSLQHMCRFVILKLVRKDLINTLPLPRRVIDYLSTPHYYSEQLVEEDSGSDGASPSPDQVVHVLSFVPQGLS